MLSAHVVAHTHWDREWYHPFVRFRQRLVALVDELLDDPPASNESFLLDGQAIVLEDYLDVRPERAAEIAALLQRGSLEAGPWYVLADELLPSGEALVRNLLLGRRVLRRLRASSPPVLYCPDSFGHPAALPAIAAGFALPLILIWRGFGGRRWPPTDTVLWQAPDGERVVTYHLPPNGYEYGSALPVEEVAARERWARMRDELTSRSATGVVIVPNGADHHARQREQRAAVHALAAAAGNDVVRASSLSAFTDELLARAREKPLPCVQGELRDSYGYTWTLQGTFASRAAQKRGNARAERLLVRDAEPWAALARRRGALSRWPLLVAAWRTLLQAHPHDTLCGCSIDAVARAMDRRLDDAIAQGVGIRDDAIADVIGHDVVDARSRKSSWHPIVIVRNRSARPRGGVAIVEIKNFIADVPVGPGSAPASTNTPMRAASSIDGAAIQLLSEREEYDRIESPRHYPDNDLVASARAAVWLAAVPAYGVAALPLGTLGGRAAKPSRAVRAVGHSLDNGIVNVSVDARGRVDLKMAGRRIRDLFVIDDRVDEGDLYTPSIRGECATAELRDVSTTHRGPLIGEVRLRWRLRSPGSRRASTLSVRVQLVAESPLVRMRIDGHNRHRDHRLRLGVRTGTAAAVVWADAAFGPVRRDPLSVPNEDRERETPPPTAPLHRYVSLFGVDAGATLFSDGLAEYEATKNGELFVTLLRAVGELSRNDLPERPGHAGWPAPTPLAQALGPFSARFALLLHGARENRTVDSIERAADDALLPLEGRTLRSALTVPAPTLGAELRGEGLAFSALKESEDGEWMVARCVNLLETPVQGSWRFGVPIREAYTARLDETLGESISVEDNTVEFIALSRATVTILVR
ncbi:MAG TPA: glycoside hydrolase family 38 C-terminal domain-containing protein [Gemmatimonadaceae bacterium]